MSKSFMTSILVILAVLIVQATACTSGEKSDAEIAEIGRAHV